MKKNTARPQRKGLPDYQLLILTLLLTGFGLVMVYSSSSSIALMSEKLNFDALYYTKRQAVYAILGVIGMFVAMNIPFAKYKQLYKPLFFITILMLVAVLFVGVEINKARSWFNLGFATLQPSEIAKISIILYLSALITKKGERFRDLKTGYIPVMIIVGFVAGLIMLQPDFGSTFILVATCGLIIYAGGASMKHIMGSIGLLILGAAIVMGAGYLVDLMSGNVSGSSYSYKLARFQSFLDPFHDKTGDSYNLVNSLTAIGTGGFTGTGIGQGVIKLHYLPNAFNDFIFAVIGEELGFIGTTIFLIIYVYFIWRGFTIALRCKDIFGTLVGVGIMGLIAIQAFINIGGVTQTIPVTGVTLPFISFGGTSLLVTMTSIGIMLSISRENNLETSQETVKSVRTVTEERPSPALVTRNTQKRRSSRSR
ncbi:putative lipid II flippase FtsW [Paenibacillus sp. An7]|uniref:putative lipid II flippase FtsW n=1 Tax=Paenibacillus sp. An7 TaxID=2689577 RepID=UPI001358F0C5|nr:putative lipid II flippase FtsW [Paenibacillus sp. An7]